MILKNSYHDFLINRSLLITGLFRGKKNRTFSREKRFYLFAGVNLLKIQVIVFIFTSFFSYDDITSFLL